MKYFLLLASIVCLCLTITPETALAQDNKEGYGEEGGGQPASPSNSPVPIVRDGVYDKISVKEKKILTYDHLREADIFWQKRIWRVIDTQQKMNLPFIYPEQPFIQVLLDIINKNSDAQMFLDDSFTTLTSQADMDARLNSVDTIFVIDPETYEEKQEIVRNEFDWTAVKQIRLKEDWVFDEESSTMQVRILGMAPIRDVIDDNGNYRGQEAMFWLYYPDYRKYFINYETFNPQNDAMRLTWDDIFEMRFFASYIMKESNIQDKRIKDYATGRDALIESERIKNELFEQEHNLWSY
ncbi:MAG: gliding motility protein GldN [Chitinophagales bacterium]